MLRPLAVVMLLKMSGLCKGIHQTGDKANSGELCGSGWKEKGEIALSALFTSELSQ